MRYFTSILVNGGLLLAFMHAPSLHVHAHEATERHEAGFLHTHVAHFEAPPVGQAGWRDFDPDDDAQFVNWFSAAASYSGFTPVTAAQSNFVLPVPEIDGERTIVLRPNAHDPPVLNATPPRAPPV